MYFVFFLKTKTLRHNGYDTKFDLFTLSLFVLPPPFFLFPLLSSTDDLLSCFLHCRCYHPRALFSSSSLFHSPDSLFSSSRFALPHLQIKLTNIQKHTEREREREMHRR
ncbi:uncharacterized protein DS421_17g577630 [Arachis hypogaea]|nr:uncharacterized protein DS421_17g577630 [Arachis hypogaea]